MSIDCMTSCYSGVQQQLDTTSGRAVTRIPNSKLFKIEPKINNQGSSGNFFNHFDNRLNHPTYYH